MKKIIYTLCCFYFASCAKNKVLLKNNIVYTYSTESTPNGSAKDVYTPYRVIKSKKDVEITDNGSYLLIKGDPSSDKEHYVDLKSADIPLKNMTSWKRELGSKSYFAEASHDTKKVSLWYRDEKFVLQTATIPVKIRSAVREPAYKDSFPSQVETGVNVGFLIGGKQTWNRYRTSANILGQKTDKYSITGGVLLSAGSVDLSTSTTRPKIEFPRKAAMMSYGGAIVLGLNSVNLGYAFGWDKPFGVGASNWIYKGKMWSGIIVSLDLIK